MRFLKKFLELTGLVGGLLKYGPQRGDINATTYVQMAASQVLANNSGAFVTMDASGYAAMTSVGAASIYGWVLGEAQTTSATAGATKMACNINTETIFRMPVSSAYTAGASATAWRAILGAKRDLRIVSNVQGVNCDVSTAGGHVIIVDQDPWIAAVADTAVTSITATTGCRWVDVKINPAMQAKS